MRPYAVAQEMTARFPPPPPAQQAQPNNNNNNHNNNNHNNSNNSPSRTVVGGRPNNNNATTMPVPVPVSLPVPSSGPSPINHNNHGNHNNHNNSGRSSGPLLRGPTSTSLLSPPPPPPATGAYPSGPPAPPAPHRPGHLVGANTGMLGNMTVIPTPPPLAGDHMKRPSSTYPLAPTTGGPSNLASNMVLHPPASHARAQQGGPPPPSHPHPHPQPYIMTAQPGSIPVGHHSAPNIVVAHPAPPPPPSSVRPQPYPMMHTGPQPSSASSLSSSSLSTTTPTPTTRTTVLSSSSLAALGSSKTPHLTPQIQHIMRGGGTEDQKVHALRTCWRWQGYE
eukprot:TRINITY_DN4334_c0_g1_i5.p1 TRINITY_DN4334_c0_g1~~TRINITY_DN4334_c0_g1_i5.p1  ORF type:complete len:335 (+),score=100.63 TRINITY_DN4334_c0_g1_i5:251-1255(+)